MAKQQRLELTWFNKDKALIPTEAGKYGYTWVDPRDPRYCETRPLVFDEYVSGKRSPKVDGITYSERADLPPTDDNLLILGESGDVLEALTRIPELADKYVGKVKCIYIDPPFNTGDAFTHYEDNLEHSVWLTMMRDRLRHMKRLLSPEGSIWVHLDDNENHRMRLLLDEVFGPGNFQAEVVWQKADSPRSDARGFSSDHDVITVYGRSASAALNRMQRTAIDDARFTNPDGDNKGIWWDADPTAPGAASHQGMVYAIQHPITRKLMYPTAGRHWSLRQSDVLEIMGEWANYELQDIGDAVERARLCDLAAADIRQGVQAVMISGSFTAAKTSAENRHASGQWPTLFLRGEDGHGRIGRKAYPPEHGQPPRTWWPNSQVGHNRTAKSEIKALFPDDTAFATPKPERLLERIIHIATDPGDIVLDVFAGSGTTAAVAQKMGRRWVSCELSEQNFARFTRPRLEKVIRDDDSGGVTTDKGTRVPADGVELPEGMSADDAQKLTSLLNKALGEHRELKQSRQVKQIKQMVKTRKTPDTVNWRGGGGFQVAHLAPACFDYDPDLGMVMLTEAAADPDRLVASVAAQLRFRLTPDHYFHGMQGRARLYVTHTPATPALATELSAHLEDGESLVLASPTVVDGAGEALRGAARGSRVVHIPDDLFESFVEEARK